MASFSRCVLMRVVASLFVANQHSGVWTEQFVRPAHALVEVRVNPLSDGVGGAAVTVCAQASVWSLVPALRVCS